MLNAPPFFSALPEDQLADLLPAIQHRHFPARTIIVRAGEYSNGLYVIVSGAVKVTVDDGDGREFVLSVLGPNDFFGETAVIDGVRSRVSVESQHACDMLYAPRKPLLKCLHRNSGAAILLLRKVIERLHDAQEHIEALAHMTVRGRLERVLLALAREKSGEWYVELGTEQIAAMVGASREMVSRVLKDMIEGGIVARRKRQLILVDRASIALRKRARSRDPRDRDTRVAIPPAAQSDHTVVGADRRTR